MWGEVKFDLTDREMMCITRARIAVRSGKPHRGVSVTKQRPIILGIVGDSAAGKTTIMQGLVNILCVTASRTFAPTTITYMTGSNARERGIMVPHPDCNYMDVIELHLERLHYGQPILKPVYDHSTEPLSDPNIPASPVRHRRGPVGFSTANMRQFYDVRVYLAPPEEMRRLWKFKRYTTKGGYTTEQVLKVLEGREADSRDYIRPQKKYADIVVTFHGPHGVPPEQAGFNLTCDSCCVPRFLTPT